MNKIYLAICEDRHIDATVMAFTSPEDAIEYAHEFLSFHQILEPVIEGRLTDEMRKNGWLWVNEKINEDAPIARVEESQLFGSYQEWADWHNTHSEGEE